MKRISLVLLALVVCCFGRASAKPLVLKPLPVDAVYFTCPIDTGCGYTWEHNGPHFLLASTLTIPNVFISGTTILSASMNANFSTIASWGNGNIDTGNIGAAGIKLSQIKCSSTADCTLGATVATTLPVPVIFSASSITAASSVAIWNDNAATNGIVLNVPTGSTNGFQYMVNGVQKVQFDNTGTVKTAGGASISTGTTVIDFFLGQAASPTAANAYPTIDVDATNHLKVTKEFVRCLTQSSSGSVTFTFTGTTLAALVLPASTSTASATVTANDMAGNSINVTASGGTGEANCAVKLVGTVVVN